MLSRLIHVIANDRIFFSFYGSIIFHEKMFLYDKNKTKMEGKQNISALLSQGCHNK
jgi:hypothetical protein